MPASVPPAWYDALADRWFAPEVTPAADGSLTLRLLPWESLFVMFDPGLDPTRFTARRWRGEVVHDVPLTGTWRVSTAAAETYPRFLPEPRLMGLGNWAVPGLLPTFAGTVAYELEFALAAPLAPGPDTGLRLDLGELYEIGQVWVDGADCGVRLAPPYHFDLPAPLTTGRHHLRIEVTNTLAKQCANAYNDRYRAQEPAGLLGPVRLVIGR